MIELFILSILISVAIVLAIIATILFFHTKSIEKKWEIAKK